MCFQQTWLTISLVCLSTLLYAQPVVQSFSPNAAMPGSPVIISGSGFSNSASANTVFFGATKASVINASATSITVQVPVGATYAPISVSVNGLNGYSTLPFMPQFGNAQPLAQASFGVDQVINTDYYPRTVNIHDLDLDGKPDLVALRYLPNNIDPNYVMAFRNVSIDSNIQLAAPNNFFIGSFATDMAMADMDGDGKTDAVVSSIVPNEISVIRNTSSPGSISFATRFFISKNDAAYNIALADMDGDGKTDIAASNYIAGTISLYRNTSTPGNLSFATAITIPTAASPRMVLLSDFNNDGKPELLVACELIQQLVLYANNSSPGSFSFNAQPAINSPDAYRPFHLVSGDLNSDGLNDLLITTLNELQTSGNIYAYRNTGSLQFVNDGALPQSTPASPSFKPAIADTDGDGKPDVASGLQGAFHFGIRKNNSVQSGAINFLTPFVWYSGSANQVALGDLNGDGSPELVTANTQGTALGLFKNKSGKLSITQVTPDAGGNGTVVSITGRNFTGANSVSFGGIAATSFAVLNDGLLTATVGNGASGVVQVSGPLGTDKWETFNYNNDPLIDSFAPAMAAAGDTVYIYGKNFLSTHTVQFGEVNAAWFSVVNAQLIKAIPGNGDHGYVSVQNATGFYRKDGFTFLRKPVINSISLTQGYKGQGLYITGQHLALPNILPTVTIGGVPCTYVAPNGDFSQLMVVIEDGATGFVKVSHPGGEDSIGGFTFIPPPVIQSFTPTAASPTDTVYIQGLHFTDVTQVKFGDSSAVWFTVENDQLIKAVVGHGKSGSIQLTKFSGVGSKPGFVFVPLPPPVIQSISPLEGTAGTTVEIIGQHLWGVLSIAVGGKPVTYFSSTHPDTLRFTIPVDASGTISITTYYGNALQSNPGFLRRLPPAISSFTPLAAEPGATISLSGSGFGNNMTDVTVWMGPVKAEILQIQDNQLQVRVPVSAGYDKVKVQVRELMATSGIAFTPLHAATAALPLRNNSFVLSGADINGGMAYDRQTVAADFDEDGKPDLAALSSYNGLMIYRNKSAAGSIQFEEPVYSGLSGYHRIEPADIDADGKLDIVLFGGASGVARNASTSEQLAFAYVPASIYATSFLADMNADGKPDIVSVGGPAAIRVSFNTSLPGRISFLESKDYNTAFQLPFTFLVQAGDVDMDGTIDLFGVGGNYLHVLRNTGTATQPSFTEAASSYRYTGPSASYYYPEAVSLADLNNDGKPEVLIQHNTNSTASFGIHHNISTPGSIVLNPVQIIADAATDRGIQVGDFNGDNKPDLLTGSGPWLYAYQNNSAGSSIALLPKISLQYSPDAACIADFDGDGKQDIASHSNAWIMLRNRMGEMQQQLICANGNVQLQANVSGASYQWQMDSGSGYVDVSNNANMNGTNTATLSLINVPTNWLQRSFRCNIKAGAFYSEPYKIEFANTWVGGNGNSWHTAANWSCGSVPDETTIVTVPSWKIIQVTAHASCRYLWLESYSNVAVSPGVQFVIKKQ